MDDEARTPAKTITAMKARQNFGSLLEHVYYKDEYFVIERAGRPMAAVVPLALLEEWQTRSARPTKRPDTGKVRKRRRKQEDD